MNRSHQNSIDLSLENFDESNMPLSNIKIIEANAKHFMYRGINKNNFNFQNIFRPNFLENPKSNSIGEINVKNKKITSRKHNSKYIFAQEKKILTPTFYRTNNLQLGIFKIAGRKDQKNSLSQKKKKYKQKTIHNNISPTNTNKLYQTSFLNRLKNYKQIQQKNAKQISTKLFDLIYLLLKNDGKEKQCLVRKANENRKSNNSQIFEQFEKNTNLSVNNLDKRKLKVIGIKKSLEPAKSVSNGRNIQSRTKRKSIMEEKSMNIYSIIFQNYHKSNKINKRNDELIKSRTVGHYI